MPDIHVGVDVGKSFHCMVAQNHERTTLFKGQLPQDERTIIGALESLAEPSNILVVVDQPNNIGALVVRCAISLGCHVAYIPSKAMRHEAERQGKTSKTDKIDAECICASSFEAPNLLHPVISDPTRAQIKVLRSHDRDLAHDLTKAKNRLRAALLEDMPAFEACLEEAQIECGYILSTLIEFGGPWNMKDHIRAWRNRTSNYRAKMPKDLVQKLEKAFASSTLRPDAYDSLEGFVIAELAQDIARIQQQRKSLDKKIECLLAKDDNYTNLLTMPGIGHKTAATLAADIDIESFDSPFSLAKYMGIAPTTAKSGTSINRSRACKEGNRRLKDAMFMSTFAAIQHDPISAEYYQKKIDQGKTFPAAIMALARKRCKVIYKILKDKKPYEPRRVSLVN